MIRSLLAIIVCLISQSVTLWAEPAPAERPNIVLIMTDDQGHGDLGFHGNPIIRTPHLDKFAQQSVRMKYFYVSPVCSPTRASLMTGRYNYRTGVVDTYLGRSMMHADEVTIAEMLSAAGYQTAIIGKWHLGDCYPLRAMDQGFDEALVHKGGGIGQPADPPGNSYFDPVLFLNGKAVKTEGYCSDIFTDAAVEFVTKNRGRPFFLYLSFNCPHTPLQVPEKYYGMYKNKDLSHDRFPAIGNPLPGNARQDDTARVYGMVTNIDENLGRLFAKLDELKISDNTIVIFLTDNGPQQVRYNSGMLGRKGTVHEGGVRVPCFVRWPAQLKGNRDVQRIAAHIDIVPTLLDASGAAVPANVKFDGASLMPLLQGKGSNWPDRLLFFQWHRGDVPTLYRACAVRNQKYRLLQPSGYGNTKMPAQVRFQLYDIETDPFTKNDIAAGNPRVVAQMKKAYTEWFKDVGSTRGYAPPRIHLGSPQQKRVVLTKQDWRGPAASWGRKGLGHWEVKVANGGKYTVVLDFTPQQKERTAHFRLGEVSAKASVPAGTKTIRFEEVSLKQGPGRVEAFLAQADRKVGVSYVTITKSAP